MRKDIRERLESGFKGLTEIFAPKNTSSMLSGELLLQDCCGAHRQHHMILVPAEKVFYCPECNLHAVGRASCSLPCTHGLCFRCQAAIDQYH